MKRRIIEITIAIMIIFALSFSSFAMFTYQNKRPVSSSVGTGSSKTSSVTSAGFSNVAEYPSANSDISFSSSKKPSSSKISISKKPTSSSSKTSSSSPVVIVTEVKATWMSYIELKAIFSNSKNDSSLFRKTFTDHLNKLKAFGINTVIVQVRPFGDALYISSLFPWSSITGEIGKAPSFDPLAIMIEIAHNNGMLIEAWINPFRAHNKTDAQTLAAKYNDFTFSKWYNKKDEYVDYIWLDEGGTEKWYLNPGIPDVRKFIIDGVKEIVSKYNVDGIHFDDYFYPTALASFDSKAFSTYGGGLSLGDWRRNNVSSLVKDVYSAVKAIKPAVKFGISPSGNINPTTKISKAYTDQYADIEKWCSTAGYVDYICPQIYFGFLNSTMPFETVIREWSTKIKVIGLKFYVGLSPSKTGVYDQYAGNAKNEWVQNSDILKRQVELLRTIKNCSGFSLYSYTYVISPKNNIAVQEMDNLKKIM